MDLTTSTITETCEENHVLCEDYPECLSQYFWLYHQYPKYRQDTQSCQRFNEVKGDTERISY